jgi:hypothetical protein
MVRSTRQPFMLNLHASLTCTALLKPWNLQLIAVICGKQPKKAPVTSHVCLLTPNGGRAGLSWHGSNQIIHWGWHNHLWLQPQTYLPKVSFQG